MLNANRAKVHHHLLPSTRFFQTPHDLHLALSLTSWPRLHPTPLNPPSPGEPVFIAAPDSQAEDDGVVVCPGAGPEGNAFVAVLDAKDLKELGRAEMPFATPHRFHGIWLDE